MGKVLFMRKGETHTSPRQNLPSGYTELAYIQSNGAQYVDSLFAPNANTRLVMSFEPTAAYSSIVGIFGVRDTNASTAPLMFVLWNNGNSSFRSDYFGTQQSLTVSTLLAKHTVDKNKNLVTIDTASAEHTAATGQCTRNLYLFCANAAGTANYFSSYKLYSCQIYDNGTLVRDFIPCINDSGTVGLYDLVGKKFYGNSGTGAFGAGDVVEYSLPAGYEKLAYIQSSGTQHVDMGLALNQNSRIVLDFQNESTSFKSLCGAQAASNTSSLLFYLNNSTVYPEYGNSKLEDYSIAITTTTRLVYELSASGAKVGNTSKSVSAATFSTGCNATLFVVNVGGTLDSRKAVGKLYSCQIYDNGTFVRWYVPVVTNTGEVGLWDVITRKFYGNAGTGVFIGSEVA